jgi:hypothetical protein
MEELGSRTVERASRIVENRLVGVRSEVVAVRDVPRAVIFERELVAVVEELGRSLTRRPAKRPSGS